MIHTQCLAEWIQLHFPTVVTVLMMDNFFPSILCLTSLLLHSSFINFLIKLLVLLVSGSTSEGELRPIYASSTILWNKRRLWLGLRNCKWKPIKASYICLFFVRYYKMLPLYTDKLSSFLKSLLSLYSCSSLSFLFFKLWLKYIYIAYRFTVFTTWTKNMLYLYMLKITWIGHMLASKYVISRRNSNVNLFTWASIIVALNQGISWQCEQTHTNTHTHTTISTHVYMFEIYSLILRIH